MTKLIGHHYNKDKGIFETFSIEVKETSKQFSKPDPCNRLYDFSEYWSILPKDQLDKLREVYRGYSMFSLQENMALFKNLLSPIWSKFQSKKSLHMTSLWNF